MAIAYLALGSNLGDRRAHLDAAVATLRAHPAVRDVRVSRFIETDPVGGPPGQGPGSRRTSDRRTCSRC